jgi:hypothetical protein
VTLCLATEITFAPALTFVIPTGVVMGLRPTQGDGKRLLSSNRSLWKRHPPLCHPEPGFPVTRHRNDAPRAAFGDGKAHVASRNPSHSTGNPGRSRGICSSADLSWKCFSTERTRISCCAALEEPCVFSVRKLAEPTNFNRKWGGALQFLFFTPSEESQTLIPGHLRGESDSQPRARSEYTAADLRLRVCGEAGR